MSLFANDKIMYVKFINVKHKWNWKSLVNIKIYKTNSTLLKNQKVNIKISHKIVSKQKTLKNKRNKMLSRF